MEKKTELSPELKAKLEEIKRKHDVRELSMEELDGVAGGSAAKRLGMSEEEMKELLCCVYSASGFDDGVLSFAASWGFHSEAVMAIKIEWRKCGQG